MSDLVLRNGLTMREHFAGLIAAELSMKYSGPKDIARNAVQIADALIAELKKSAGD